VKDFYYQRLEHHILLQLLKKPEYASSLAYLVDYSHHNNLQVIPRPCSIEISNDQIALAVILFVGFENEEYEAIKHRKNLHLLSFSEGVPTMNEFKHLKVKHVDHLSWLFMILSRSNHPELVDLRLLKSLTGI
jgi:hypothetical protein